MEVIDIPEMVLYQSREEARRANQARAIAAFSSAGAGSSTAVTDTSLSTVVGQQRSRSESLDVCITVLYNRIRYLTFHRLYLRPRHPNGPH